MINYVQTKPINQNRISELLEVSKKANQFTNNGPVKKLLEKKLEEMIDCPEDKAVLCVSNGTTALHALVLYYEKLYNKKLKWVSPSLTFPTCVVNNMHTELVDIDPLTYTIKAGDIGDCDGVIITNLFGTVANVDQLNFHNKIVIYDNASSFLSKKNGKNICLYGNAAFVSLHHTKTFGFGEGGFLVIDRAMYRDLQAICGFGFNGNRIHDVYSSNFKMSDVVAAYILQHIEGYDIDKHLLNQTEFIHQINQINGVQVFNCGQDVFYGNMPILFDKAVDVEYFRNFNIEANKYYLPLADHRNSIEIYNRIINFPLHQDLSIVDIHYICNVIKSYT